MLNKSIYGLRQSGREWNSELDNILDNLGFYKLKWCNCVYKLNSNAILVVYVDDLVLFAKDENVLQSVTNMLKDSLEITEIELNTV